MDGGSGSALDTREAGRRRVRAGAACAGALLVLSGSGLLGPASSNPARAARPVKIGVLTESWGVNPQTAGLRDGLRELGYREESDFVIGVRFTRGDAGELARAAKDLIAEGADILFASAGMAVEAAQAATSQRPIVFAGGDDPVGRGLVRTIARPGRNITGVLDLGNELAGKRLQIFREIVPGLQRVLVAYAAGNRWAESEAQAYRDAAATLGITLVERPLRSRAEAQAAFTQAELDGVQGVLVSHSVAWNVPGFAMEAGARLKLPGMFASSFYAERGGLASYGPDYRATGRQAARLVDKIIRGVPPGEIPVESNPRIELAINTTTARRLRLEIPRVVLVRANRIFE